MNYFIKKDLEMQQYKYSLSLLDDMESSAKSYLLIISNNLKVKENNIRKNCKCKNNLKLCKMCSRQLDLSPEQNQFKEYQSSLSQVRKYIKMNKPIKPIY